MARETGLKLWSCLEFKVAKLIVALIIEGRKKKLFGKEKKTQG